MRGAGGNVAFGSCGLCLRPRQVFYCATCVCRGDFVHSTSPLPDRFSDKKLRFIHTKSTRKYVEDKCEKIIKIRMKKLNIAIAIKQSEERRALLESAIHQKNDNIKSYTAKLNSIKEYNEQMAVKLPIYKENIDSIRKYADGKKKEIESRRTHLYNEQKLLHCVRKHRIIELTKFVFPIKEISSHSLGYGNISCTERAIAEASRPAKISDEFVLPSLQILNATLPLDGDYGAYCHWVATNKGLIGSTNNPANIEPVSQNSAYRISAALAYSAQLIRILAYYIDIRLPFNITYSDLCSNDIEERRFKRIVVKLQSCAAVLLNSIKLNKMNDKITCLEPPLHTLLRLCPVEPHKNFYEQEIDDISYETDNYNSSKEYWWGGADRDISSLITSDDDEPEPPEHLHWDVETEPDVASSSPNSRAGIMTNAAASIVSIWRVFTK